MRRAKEKAKRPSPPKAKKPSERQGFLDFGGDAPAVRAHKAARGYDWKNWQVDFAARAERDARFARAMERLEAAEEGASS